MNKKRFTFLAALLIAVSIFGQLPEKTSILEGNNQKMAPAPAAPEQISYQAVVRDDNNATVANQVVGMQISFLQTTANGTAVYVETQTPTTNANGLLSIYIGAGSAVTATFSVIDWSIGPYFIKIEIDPSGDNANYTITGTTQLVSVPFALYAKTAGSSATNATNIAALESRIAALDIAVLDIAALEARIAALEPQPSPANVGDLREGGIVFWVDPDNNMQGLVCALEDLSYEGNDETGLYWDDAISYSNSYTNSDTGTGVHSDWYLPSKEELQLMYVNLQRFECTTLTPDYRDIDDPCETHKGNFLTTGYMYWSSTEYGTTRSWRQSFEDGYQSRGGRDYMRQVRAIRAF